MDKRPRQRLDKWLWHARFGRTRTLAAKSVQSGFVRLNRVKILKPAHAVSAGDVLTIFMGNEIRVIRVLGMTDRRVSPEVAATLYEELTQPQAPLAPHAEDFGAQKGGWQGPAEAHSPF